MATYVQTVDIGHFATVDEREALTREALTHEVRRGLTARPRSLSPWMFYDAEGSRLFERITMLPEYYPTRTERAILAGYADAIIAAAHGDRSLPLRLVELGAGTASKTWILLEAALRVSDDVAYVPVDVCPDALELACQSVACTLPEVRMQPIVRNYVTHPLQLDPPSTVQHSRSTSAQASATFHLRKRDSSCEIWVLSHKSETRCCSVQTW
jgi:uncharacterized SAM-dependent methyltransferase